MKNHEVIVILDFGGQYSQLIARRVRECHVYSELMPYDSTIETIKAKQPKGIILSGGPSSVYEEDAPQCDKQIFGLGIPVLRHLLWYATYGKAMGTERLERHRKKNMV